MEEEQYQAIFNYVKKKEYPLECTKSQKYVLRRSCKSYVVDGEQLFYVDYRPDGSTFNRLVLRGRDEIERVFLECHLTAGGHKGRDATLRKIKERYYWPNYYKEVEEKIKMCDRCQRNAPQLKTAAMELHPVKVLPQVWYLVGMDLIGPFQPTAYGDKYVLTMTDYFSKYVEAVPIPDKSAVSVAGGIYKVYCRHGAPVSVISDQGKEFVNQLNEALQESFGVKLRITSAYHPQSNGLDERMNQTLKRSLSKLMVDRADDWGKYLDAAVFATNTSVQCTTKVTPFRMMFGREPRFPLKVYDSMHMNLSSSMKRTIAELLQTRCNRITIEYVNMQFQKGGSDCGLFAIATATALCHGENPLQFEYTQGSMRNHLLKAFEMKALCPFPGKRTNNSKEFLQRENLQVYCKCRLPDDGRQMIQCTGCKMWFHVDCVQCPKRALQKGVPWYCETCM